MRILVTGSRTWDDEELISRVLRKAKERYGYYTLVSGACPRGADAICEAIAHALGCKIERHPARWDLNGRAAGFKRNEHMVTLKIDRCFAFIKDHSKGATHCARSAQNAGIRTNIWRAPSVGSV